MLTRLGRNYKKQAQSGIASSARLEQAREDRQEALDQAEEANRKSNMSTGAGMGLANASKIAGTLGVGGASTGGGAAALATGSAGGQVASLAAAESAAGLTTGATPALGASMAVPVIGIGVGLLAALALSDLF